MASLFDRITHSRISRRRFIQASAAAAAGLSLAGCGNSLTTANADKMTSQEGKWITAACWHNWGGRCLNKAYVVDGVVVRQKTDDTHPDNPNYFQQRACLRGRAQRNQVFGADPGKGDLKHKDGLPHFKKAVHLLL
ncbi:Tat (twin-arginine translocation) pathway signal sequence [Desulfitobacterium chlororespirans DSM 11544]|uniref:Tat (Twin-arginine translocation) pathway signal sequence n=1 Tax=Desulfitobacterium chlororespirans DSM 11544 TaxID=1121395 RepID=A0A1M7TR69_9FIRM|nr:Tat (twin-arginine translocation) pathway signal sequence [Desulfitobacterium chlororespirans DSM 11544]